MGGDERCAKDFGRETLRETDHLRDPSVDGRITKKWIFSKWALEGMDWIELTQDRHR
jgi:hypothetical protein